MKALRTERPGVTAIWPEASMKADQPPFRMMLEQAQSLALRGFIHLSTGADMRVVQARLETLGREAFDRGEFD